MTNPLISVLLFSFAPGQMQEVSGSRFDGPARTIIIIEVLTADP